MATYTTNKNLTKPADGSATWGDPTNGDWDAVDQALAGIQYFNLTTGNVNLTNYLRILPPNQIGDNSYIPGMLIFNGTLTGNVNIIFPNTITGHWIVGNYTTSGTGGPFTITCGVAGTAGATFAGTTFVLQPNILSHIFSNALNILPIGATGAATQLAMVGEIKMFAGTGAPYLWQQCSGQSLLISQYPALYSVIGTTYGQVDGQHFSVPDFRGYVPAGVDGTGTGQLPGWYNGSKSGANAFQLSAAQLPPHVHGIADHTHWDSGHTHGLNGQLILGYSGGAGGTTGVAFGWGNPTTVTDYAHLGYTEPPLNQTNSQGSNAWISLLQPTQGVNFIIYAGAP